MPTTAGVFAQTRVELAMADVDGVDAPRAARQQHIGEAAGRSADIETIEAMRIEPESVERRRELDAAARDPGMGRARCDRARPAATPSEGLRKTTPSTDTRPGLDRRLRAGAARKMAKFDKDDVGAFAHDSS